MLCTDVDPAARLGDDGRPLRAHAQNLARRIRTPPNARRGGQGALYVRFLQDRRP